MDMIELRKARHPLRTQMGIPYQPSWQPKAQRFSGCVTQAALALVALSVVSNIVTKIGDVL